MGRTNYIESERIHHSGNGEEGPALEGVLSTSKTASWKVSLFSGACACVVVLAANLAVTIWSTISLKGSEDGIKTSRRIIYEGPCSTSRTLSVIIHLLINVFGSILLAASNYGMQCLSAPTRADVDKAHARHRWMDIGIPSFRNLQRVSRRRVILWCLLVFSSVPLHLLFNSVVFSSLTTYPYEVFPIDMEFRPTQEEHAFSESYNATIKKMKAGQLERLDRLDCINEYAVAFQTKRSNLLVVVDPSSSESDVKKTHDIPSTLSHIVPRIACGYSEYDWICPRSVCDEACRNQLPKIKLQLDDWRPYGDQVEYCLSQPMPEKCRLNFDVHTAAIILAVNLIKAVILVLIALRPPKEPLFVLGDAIESFLMSPDESSRGNCLTSMAAVRAQHMSVPCTMPAKCKFRGAAVTGRRWFSSFIMYGIALGVSCFLLGWGIYELTGPRDLKSLWNLGFGAATELTLIGGLGWEDKGEQGLFQNVLLSNLPQLIFSLLYFQYNGLFTCMAAAKEWSDFGHKRKSLRVSSNPRGDQRSRYFLQLPYHFSIPLLLVSILMHWMLSQSIFIVAVEARGYRGEGYHWEYLTCGYSPIAIIFVIITSVFMATAVIITACWRLPSAMPVSGSCSLAIAAACHHPDGIPQLDTSFFPLQWGVMWRHREGSDQELTDHCGFSHRPVEKPQEGHVYH